MKLLKPDPAVNKKTDNIHDNVNQSNHLNKLHFQVRSVCSIIEQL